MLGYGVVEVGKVGKREAFLGRIPYHGRLLCQLRYCTIPLFLSRIRTNTVIKNVLNSILCPWVGSQYRQVEITILFRSVRMVSYP